VEKKERGVIFNMERIDVRGLSCPLPVVEVRKKLMAANEGVFEVLGDTGAAKDNIIRLATNMGWKIEYKEKDEEFVIYLSKKEIKEKL